MAHLDENLAAAAWTGTEPKITNSKTQNPSKYWQLELIYFLNECYQVLTPLIIIWFDKLILFLPKKPFIARENLKTKKLFILFIFYFDTDIECINY